MKYTVATILAVILLAGCSVRTENKTPQEVKNDIFYFSDDYGNCFAAINSKGSHGFITTSISTIPCERMP